MSPSRRRLHLIYVSGTSLPKERAHAIQNLNTLHALARLNPDVQVTHLATTQRADPAAILGALGLGVLPNLHLVPIIDAAWYDRSGLHGELLSRHQGWLARTFARRSVLQVLRAARNEGRGGVVPTALLTRRQEVMQIGGPAMRRLVDYALIEHHQFEYVRVLKGKLAKKRTGRRTLGDFKRLLAAERAEELSRLRTFDAVLPLTRPIEARLVRLGLGRPQFWLPSGVDLGFQFPAEDAPVALTPAEGADPLSPLPRRVDVLYVGQLYPWKGVDLLIESVPHLPHETGVVIVGGNDAADIDRVRRRARELGVADRVRFLGHQPHPVARALMKRARVGVVPLPRRGYPEARAFTSPMKVFEFLAAGTPIVASRLPSLEEALHHGSTAVLVPPDDARALASGIRTVLEDESLARRLSMAGPAAAAAFGYDRRAQRILDAIAALEPSRPSSG